MCCIKRYQFVRARGCVKRSVALNFVKHIYCEGMSVKSSSSLWRGWTPLSGVEALQGSFSDQLLLGSPWGGFNVWYKIYLFEDTWCYMYAMFWFSREIHQYTEITTQAKYSYFGSPCKSDSHYQSLHVCCQDVEHPQFTSKESVG